MKIKLSKTQWELVGKKAGWIKTAGISEDFNAIYELIFPLFKIIEESGIESSRRFYHAGNNPKDFENDEIMKYEVEKAEKVLNAYLQFIRSIDRTKIDTAREAINNLKAEYMGMEGLR